MNPDFWRGRRVFLTGHTGFKGGWMCLWLQQLEARVTGFSLDPPTVPSLFEVARVADGMNSVIGDVRDQALLQRTLNAARPEIVFHMAAQPLVRYSYENPIETFATNVMGTVNLLEAIRQVPGISAVIVVTTDKCYENREWIWGYRENEPMGGRDPYSSSKGCAELATAAYRSSFFGRGRDDRHGVAVATVRSGNVIGGGDWARDRLVPDILRAFETGQVAHIRNPQAVRPWQHVLEPLRGYLTLAERLDEEGDEYADAWNFGPNCDDERTVEWIAGTMSELWADGAKWAVDSGEQPHEATYLKLDISKARNRLGWLPSLSLRQSLELTLEWARARRTGADMRNFSLLQIRSYLARSAA